LAGGGTVIPVREKGCVNIVADVEGRAKSFKIENSFVYWTYIQISFSSVRSKTAVIE